MKAPEPPILEARELRRRSHGGDVLLDDVSLKIAAGERWAIAGSTGSGKTVLLRALALLDPLDGGDILWNGRTVGAKETPAFRRDVIYLQQKPAMIEGTVEDNLKLPFEFAANRNKSYDRDRCIVRLTTLRLDASFLNKNTADLSGGESQITALLRAAQLDPSLLLLDEPTAALDASTVEFVEMFINDWFAESPAKRAIVWVTHDADQRKRVAESTIALQNGRVVE